MIIYPKEQQSGVNRKFSASVQYTNGSSMDAVVYVTTVVKHIFHHVVNFPVKRANNADNIQHNLLILPNYDEPDLPRQVAGAFPGRFNNWRATLLWGSNTSLGAPLQNSAPRAFQVGAQLVLAKATEVSQAHLLIAGVSCVSTANLTQQ